MKRLFAILEFFQKTNETIRSLLLGKKNEFIHLFFGRIVDLKKTLRLYLTFTYEVKKWMRLEFEPHLGQNGVKKVLLGNLQTDTGLDQSISH